MLPYHLLASIKAAPFKDPTGKPYGAFANTTGAKEDGTPAYPIIQTININGKDKTFNWFSSEHAFHAQKIIYLINKHKDNEEAIKILEGILQSIENSEKEYNPRNDFRPLVEENLGKLKDAKVLVSGTWDEFNQQCLAEYDYSAKKYNFVRSQEFMRTVIRLKLEQHADLRELAMACAREGVLPIEVSRHDENWASGLEGKGKNLLGIIIFEEGKRFLEASPSTEKAAFNNPAAVYDEIPPEATNYYALTRLEHIKFTEANIPPMQQSLVVCERGTTNKTVDDIMGLSCNKFIKKIFNMDSAKRPSWIKTLQDRLDTDSQESIPSFISFGSIDSTQTQNPNYTGGVVTIPVFSAQVDDHKLRLENAYERAVREAVLFAKQHKIPLYIRPLGIEARWEAKDAARIFAKAIRLADPQNEVHITIPIRSQEDQIFKEALENQFKIISVDANAPRRNPRSTLNFETKEQIVRDVFEFKTLPGDGNCFYNAVACHFGIDQQNIRDLISNEIWKNPSRYDHLITIFDNQNPKRTAQEYATDVKNKEWAGNLEILILMKLLNRPIVVIDQEGNLRNKSDFEAHQNKGEPIFVRFNGTNHYDALLPRLPYSRRLKDVLNELLRLNPTPVKVSVAPGLSSQGKPEETAKTEENVKVKPPSAAQPDTSCSIDSNVKEDVKPQVQSEQNPDASLSAPPKQKGKFVNTKSLLQTIEENPELFQDWQQVETHDETLRYKKNHLEIIVTQNKVFGACRNDNEREVMYDKMAEAMALAGHKSVTINIKDNDPKKFELLKAACMKHGMTVTNKLQKKEEKENVAPATAKQIPVATQMPMPNLTNM